MESKDFGLVILGILIGAILLYFVGPSLGLTGNATQNCQEYTCNFEDRTAKYEPIGSQQCSGRVTFWGGSDECTIQLKNTEEEQSAKYSVNFNCKTVDTTMTKTSQEITLAPGQTGDFTVKFGEADKLDWRCERTEVKASTVKGCTLTLK